MKQQLQRLVLRFAISAAVLALAAIAAGFALATLYIFVAGVLNIMLAALVTGGGALILAGLIATTGWIARLRTRHGGNRRRDEADELGTAAAAKQWLKGNAKTASLAALVLGIAAGASPELRRTLLRLLRDLTA